MNLTNNTSCATPCAKSRCGCWRPAERPDILWLVSEDNTIVFYYADNGGVLPRSKRFLQESGTHVPLMIHFPPKWRHLAPAGPGSRVKQPVSFVDFAPAAPALRKCLEDASGAVQVAAAEALARQDQTDTALKVLERRLHDPANPWFALQAANVLDRLGEAARPALPAMRKVRDHGYIQRILEHAMAVRVGNRPD